MRRIPEAVKRKFDEIEALEKQRKEQQGLGRPIISAVFRGERFVAVGEQPWSAPQEKWKTFHDFLFSYIRSILGGRWADDELKKPKEDRHELLNWFESTMLSLRSARKEAGKIHTVAATGAASAFLDLAYNLYLIAHNVGLQESLIRRLKNPEAFLPACYEASVAGAFIRAGFSVRFEDESDPTRKHCEFVAAFQATGKEFSVEAKLRRPDKTSADIGNQLYAALRKSSDKTRIVFIEVNVPEGMDDQNRPARLQEVLESLRTREEKLKVDGKPAPPAYIAVTNNPHYYSPDAPTQKWVIAEGFKIPDFKFEGTYPNLREALVSRERHIEMTNLMQSFAFQEVPSTFDAENPDLAFGQTYSRLKIGDKYRIPDQDRVEIVAELQSAVVLEAEKAVYGFYKTDDGKIKFCSCPLTDDELKAYKRHPHTFFGAIRPVNHAKTPLELYDWLLSSYGKATKQQLIQLLKSAKDFDALQELSQPRLAEIFCERTVYSILAAPTGPGQGA